MGRTQPEGAGVLRMVIFPTHEEEVDAGSCLGTHRGTGSRLLFRGPLAKEIRGKKKGAGIQDAGAVPTSVAGRS